MNVISGRRDTLSQDLYLKVGRYRRQVFVEHLGWNLEVQADAEFDQFDDGDTEYVVIQDNDENIIGCARLISTARPYLLGQVFPQLLGAKTPPCSSDTWELSRFAAVDVSSPRFPRVNQFSSSVAVSLLRASMTHAAAKGAKNIITVSPIGVERLLLRAGFSARRAGLPVVVDGCTLFACWIDLTQVS